MYFIVKNKTKQKNDVILFVVVFHRQCFEFCATDVVDGFFSRNRNQGWQSMIFCLLVTKSQSLYFTYPYND